MALAADRDTVDIQADCTGQVKNTFRNLDNVAGPGTDQGLYQTALKIFTRLNADNVGLTTIATAISIASSAG